MAGDTPSLEEAVRLAEHDLETAIQAVRAIRRRALRVGDQKEANACLVALRLFANVSGDERSEFRIARQLVSEQHAWFDLYWLGQMHDRKGRAAKARELYAEALRACPKGDPDRDLVESAIAALDAKGS